MSRWGENPKRNTESSGRGHRDGSVNCAREETKVDLWVGNCLIKVETGHSPEGRRLLDNNQQHRESPKSMKMKQHRASETAQ